MKVQKLFARICPKLGKYYTLIMTIVLAVMCLSVNALAATDMWTVANDISGPNYYAAHGSMGGAEDAIGYDEKMFAKKFLTEDSARTFIRDELPEWGRSIHHPKEMTPCEIMIDCPALFGALLENDDEKIRLALEPPGTRMLIWRR